METVEISTREIKQHCNPALLHGLIGWNYAHKDEYLIKAISKYRHGCSKRNKCKEIIYILEKLYEWKTTENEEEKKQIIHKLVERHAASHGKLRVTVQKLLQLL